MNHGSPKSSWIWNNWDVSKYAPNSWLSVGPPSQSGLVDGVRCSVCVVLLPVCVTFCLRCQVQVMWRHYHCLNFRRSVVSYFLPWPGCQGFLMFCVVLRYHWYQCVAVFWHHRLSHVDPDVRVSRSLHGAPVFAPDCLAYTSPRTRGIRYTPRTEDVIRAWQTSARVWFFVLGCGSFCCAHFAR